MTTSIRAEDIKNIIYGYRDDAEMTEAIMDALKSFEKYHSSIYELETLLTNITFFRMVYQFSMRTITKNCHNHEANSGNA